MSATTSKVHLLGLCANWNEAFEVTREELKQLRTACSCNLSTGDVMKSWKQLDKRFKIKCFEMSQTAGCVQEAEITPVLQSMSHDLRYQTCS